MEETPLRQARKRRGLSVREVADAVGADASNMSRFETGHHLPPVKLARELYKFYAGELDIIDLYDPTFMDEVGIIRKSGKSRFTVRTRSTRHRVYSLDSLRRLLHFLATGEQSARG